MPGSYVPPHLRNKTSSKTSPASHGAQTEDCFSLEEIYEHFWEIEQADQTGGGRTYTSESLSRTLHGSKKNPNKLAFVILFGGANPRWETDHTVFTKSNLDLLPDAKSGNHVEESVEKLEEEVGGEGATSASTGESERAEPPIPAFKQVGFGQRKQAFKFEGWYRVALVDFLAPDSPELVRMLEQKWTKNKGGKTIPEARSSESWQKSLALRWAVVKFVRDDDARTELGAPKIKRKPEQPMKSVNEMLAEMRVKEVTNQAAPSDPASSKAKGVVGSGTATEFGDA